LKKYVTPSIACVELRTEEKFAACSDGSCDFDSNPTKTRSGIAAEHLLVSVLIQAILQATLLSVKDNDVDGILLRR
jgi:hypothetical protein